MRVLVIAFASAALASVFMATACAGNSAQQTEPASSSSSGPPAPAQGIVRNTGDARVGAWVSSPWTFSTTSYFIDAPEGLILVDTQFLPKDALAFAEAAERATGKRAVVAVVLHANPDKFNGTAALQARGVRVITSSAVAALIPAVHDKRLRAFGERYAPDYPTQAAQPEIVDDAEVSLAGLNVRLHHLGAGCSAAHLALEADGNLFVGDLVANGSHAWLEIGETLQWLVRLDELAALSPRRVHPGRGLSAGPELLTAQRRYLDDVIRAVAAESPRLPVDDAGMARARRALVSLHPTLRFPVFLDIGLPAEWRRQAVLATP